MSDPVKIQSRTPLKACVGLNGRRLYARSDCAVTSGGTPPFSKLRFFALASLPCSASSTSVAFATPNSLPTCRSVRLRGSRAQRC
eukprot:3734519-Pleurochrysis_carterae.AAC.3